MSRLEAIRTRLKDAPKEALRPYLGSGNCVMTALGYDREEGGVTFVADFLPDYFLKGEKDSLDDHRPFMAFVQHAAEDIRYLLDLVEKQAHATENSQPLLICE